MHTRRNYSLKFNVFIKRPEILSGSIAMRIMCIHSNTYYSFDSRLWFNHAIASVVGIRCVCVRHHRRSNEKYIITCIKILNSVINTHDCNGLCLRQTARESDSCPSFVKNIHKLNLFQLFREHCVASISTRVQYGSKHFAAYCASVANVCERHQY